MASVAFVRVVLDGVREGVKVVVSGWTTGCRNFGSGQDHCCDWSDDKGGRYDWKNSTFCTKFRILVVGGPAGHEHCDFFVPLEYVGVQDTQCALLTDDTRCRYYLTYMTKLTFTFILTSILNTLLINLFITVDKKYENTKNYFLTTIIKAIKFIQN